MAEKKSPVNGDATRTPPDAKTRPVIQNPPVKR
jgi:hypothetical protein